MDFTILILVLPLLSFLVLGLAGTKLKPGAAGAIGTVVLGAVTVLSYLTAILYFGAGRNAEGIFPTLMPYNAVWLPISQTLHIDMGILLDPISVMMLVVISTVSLMVHIYSFGYMKGERGFQRYYAFLSLFTMSMLGLVVATNIFQMYLFWELVGVSSYLLIGFYYTKPEAIAASKKAFIVTRFADLGFLIGILFYGYYAGTFSFTPDAQLLAAAGTIIPLALGLMFIGGAGKSAMFPLHIWLPDAMEGPTPVSALIHAATMVVAGVYLVARMFPLYIGYAPDVLHWVAYIGAFTALYAAVVACVQSDIKRVLAFSTISQIGFMLVALGVCTSSDPHTGGLGYMASMFHLFTHAMFKALLFLCAGCIIHAVHSNEMSAMGGMRKYMPVTHIIFPRRLSGHRRYLAVERFLLQGRDPDRLLRIQSSDGLGDDGYRRTDGLLYVPALLRYLLGQGEQGTACTSHAARSSGHDDRSSRRPGRDHLRRGIHSLRRFHIERRRSLYDPPRRRGSGHQPHRRHRCDRPGDLDVPAGQTARRRPARHDLQRPAQGGLPPLLHRRGVSVRHAPDHLRLHFASDRLVRPSRGGRLHEPAGPDNPERRTGDPLHAERQRTALLHLVLCRDARPDPFVTHPPIIRTL